MNEEEIWEDELVGLWGKVYACELAQCLLSRWLLIKKVNKWLTVFQLWLMSITSDYSGIPRRWWLPRDAGHCNISFQIWIDMESKNTPEECDLFPLKYLLKSLAENQGPILFPVRSIYYSLKWYDLFVCYWFSLSSRIPAACRILPVLLTTIFVAPQTVPGTPTGLSIWQNTLMLRHQ